jgi:hypothetical protein
MDARRGQWPHAGIHLVRHPVVLHHLRAVVETAGLALHDEEPERISRLFDETIADFSIGSGRPRACGKAPSNFVGHADRLAPLAREKGDEAQDTSSRRCLVRRREGDDGGHVDARRRCFCQNCIACKRPLCANLVDMSRSSVSDPAFSPAIWPKSSGSRARRTARGWLSRLSAIPRTVGHQRPFRPSPPHISCYARRGREREKIYNMAPRAISPGQIARSV